MGSGPPADVLVTGASGFLGSHLVEHLLRHGRGRVLALSRRPKPVTSERVVLMAHDLARPPDPRGLPETIRTIYHCASPPGGSPDVDGLLAANVTGTLWLLDYAVRTGARLVYVSSGGVAGLRPKPIAEDAPAAPTTPYLMAKLAGEMAVRASRGRVSFAVVRLFFPYGPGQRHGLLPELCGRLGRGQAVAVGPGGAPAVNPVHVRDAARLIHGIALEGAADAVVNVAGAEVVTMRELATRLGAQLGARPRFARDEARRGHLVGATTRLHRRHGRARIPLERGLAEVAAWWHAARA